MSRDFDIRAPDDPRLVAVVLHPHPHFGGNRFHPFVDGLHRRLPAAGAAAIRFDFDSADLVTAQSQVESALEEASVRWPRLGIVLAGYSFGAGVAAGVADERVTGWFLLAPQAESLTGSALGRDPRPKLIVVPELDQFGPPEVLRPILDGWPETTVSVAPGTDHFLGDVAAIVDLAVEWISGLGGR